MTERVSIKVRWAAGLHAAWAWWNEFMTECADAAADPMAARAWTEQMEAQAAAHAATVAALRFRIAELERRGLPGEDIPYLTAAEIERLAMLAEECGEVVQAISKVLRHGWNSQSPYGGKPNRIALERELGDVRAIVNMMLDADDVRLAEIQTWQRSKRRAMRQWTHHQCFGQGATVRGEQGEARR